MIRLLPNTKVLYMGTEAGMESSIAPREGFRFSAVRSSGVMGKSPAVAAKGLFNASRGVADAVKALKDFAPDVVLGTGGYASGPVVLAAKLLRIPRAIQEQNAVPGKTNAFLSRLSQRTFAAWDYSVKFFPDPSRVAVTGNPVRSVLFGAKRSDSREFFGLPGEGQTALLLGGSRGAKTLVEAGVRLAGRLPEGASMLFITGREYYAGAVKALKANPLPGIEGARTGNIILRPYVHDMARAYGASDVVIGRAGGMTLSEVTALGLSSIIVPSPNVAGNHQEYNARALEEAGAAIVVREDKDAVEAVCEAVLGLLTDAEKRAGIAEAAGRIGKPSAAGDICRALMDLARTGK
jgi:UDP-N-acetylglucosamine--N-acetylmuramyl-(pentapeptide) pyrophosphoryl-undecaprenol N-acetylglucosamine transferase